MTFAPYSYILASYCHYITRYIEVKLYTPISLIINQLQNGFPLPGPASFFSHFFQRFGLCRSLSTNLLRLDLDNIYVNT